MSLAVRAGAIVVLAAALGCSRHSTAAPGATIPPSKVNLKRVVDLVQVEQRPLVYYVETVGILEAEGVTDLAAGVKGVVDDVNFREGDLVEPNQKLPLVKIDEKTYLAALHTAEANEQRALATRQLTRDRDMRARQAGVASSDQERREAQLNLTIAEAELQSARAALDLAKHNYARSTVRPPYQGRINKRMVTAGSYVEDKTVIATMADLSRMRLVGYVPENAVAIVRSLMDQQLGRLRAARIGLSVGGLINGPWTGLLGDLAVRTGDVPTGYDPEFTVPAFPNRAFRARIFYLSTVADPATHMFECKAEVDLRGIDVELKPGFTARIRLPVQSTLHACVVPEESVRATELGFVVFEPELRTGPDGVADFVARLRPLEIGYRAPGFVEVRRGISVGQWVVRRGSEALDDGSPIRFPDDQRRALEQSR
jgi:RND family efflux transporter MFP subunit